jgi:hypothetical protein
MRAVAVVAPALGALHSKSLDGRSTRQVGRHVFA